MNYNQNTYDRSARAQYLTLINSNEQQPQSDTNGNIAPAPAATQRPEINGNVLTNDAPDTLKTSRRLTYNQLVRFIHHRYDRPNRKDVCPTIELLRKARTKEEKRFAYRKFEDAAQEIENFIPALVLSKRI